MSENLELPLLSPVDRAAATPPLGASLGIARLATLAL